MLILLKNFDFMKYVGLSAKSFRFLLFLRCPSSRLLSPIQLLLPFPYTFPSSSSSLHFSSACYSPICYSTSTSSSSLATLTSTLSIYNFHLQFFLILFSFHPLFFYLLWLPCPPLPLFFFNFSLLLIFLLLNFNFHSFHYSVFQPCLFH